MTLGQNIQNARRAQGLSQEALAEKIGVSRQALGKWEKDTALPGLDNLQALAAALGIGVDALLGAENADPAVPAVTLDALRDLLAARDAEEKAPPPLLGLCRGARRSSYWPGCWRAWRCNMSGRSRPCGAIP